MRTNGATLHRRNGGFSSERARAEEAQVEFHARMQRAHRNAMHALHKCMAEFHQEMTEAENDFRAITREISGAA